MDKVSLEGLLLSLFEEDFNKNNNYSYISQLTIINIKSLIPMLNEEAVRVDYIRFLEEFKLWLSYRIGDNPSLINSQGRVNTNIYWKEYDDSIIGRIIPLILANQKYEVIEEEVIKNILFTTGNFQTLFETVSIVHLLYLIIENEDSIIDKIKENIIGFSQINYINKYGEYYRVEIEKYNGNFKVDFEREKIHLLNTLNDIGNNRYSNLEDTIKVLGKEEPKTFIGKILYGFLYNRNKEWNIPKFYINLSKYIIDLRKSRIDPDKLRIKEYILPDVFSFNKGEIFFHSLLRESKVIKKEVKDSTLTSLIQTKTGMYLFRRP
ncbi:hypothetical protein SAMN02745784_02903 [Tissierella praeacuta DSM 18095]|uniref:Uncharacterized protein n=1 Tax=Tissierella praeacuta DSM 18095 TaxID=1123404 RepID=A0A1M4Z572_9FIRM|nr:hypothetical protein [Tissierella praeacuta]SHF12736.1 hypothetical protein SAMN02745784_02903 [Tissierella praeacuta DSM 18095]SUP00648.1 Uncharacterised protein [Tissierella praeacuta]